MFFNSKHFTQLHDTSIEDYRIERLVEHVQCHKWSIVEYVFESIQKEGAGEIHEENSAFDYFVETGSSV